VPDLQPQFRRRVAAAGVLFLLVLATRWPLRATVLEEYDSANYALAVVELDLFHEQPHPPGYIFYVWATRLTHALVGDPVLALSTTSAVSGAVSAVLLLEILLPVLGLGPAMVAAVATFASAQVWLQQVRPMQDAFAMAWMLACALALVRATERGGRGRWCAAMALVGLSAGAKQVLPVFFGGVLLWAARAAWTRGGVRWIAAGAGCAVAASLAWFVPLSVHCGSPVTYLEWALGQVAWQRQNDAAAFSLSLARLAVQARATFVTAAGPAWLSVPLWSLAAIGAIHIARRRESTWLLWLLCPLLLIRLFLLGQWPRFALYYLPFVIALAVSGAGRGLASLAPTVRTVVAAVMLAGWCVLQSAHIGPTLVALHRGPSPIAAALEAVARRFSPAETVLLVDRRVLERHVTYYNRPYGFRQAMEDDLQPGLLRHARHVVKVYALAGRPSVSADWQGQGDPLGEWSLDVPRAGELSPFRDFWNVSAFELQGAYVTLRRFHMDDDGRTFATPQSAVVVFHAPPGGFILRLRFVRPGAARFVVGGRSVSWDGGGPLFDLPILPAESAEGRVRVDVVPECGVTFCLELGGVEVAQLTGNGERGHLRQ